MGKQTPILEAIRPKTARYFRQKLKPSGDCLIFTGTKNARGYGLVELMTAGKRSAVLAHRLTWVLEHGVEVPADMLVCHTCNNPSCCNPLHLYLGTHQTNSDDMVRAGRQSRNQKPMLGRKGELHPMSKHTDDQRRRAIAMRQEGKPFKEIARAIGCTRETAARWWNQHIASLS